MSAHRCECWLGDIGCHGSGECVMEGLPQQFDGMGTRPMVVRYLCLSCVKALIAEQERGIIRTAPQTRHWLDRP